jgi:hypothetical protein
VYNCTYATQGVDLRTNAELYYPVTKSLCVRHACIAAQAPLSLPLFPPRRTLPRLPLPPPSPPTMSSETLGYRSHPRPLSSVAARTLFLPSHLHPASPRRAAGDRGPPPAHRRWGQGSPACALLSGRRSSTHASSSPGTRSSSRPPPQGRGPMLAHAGKGVFSRRRCRGRGPLHCMFR